MFTVRHFLRWASLLSLAALAGCEMFSTDAWQRPSPFSGPPPPPPEKHEPQGGFTVLVDVPGQPTSARVVADVGNFAQQRGFVRQGAAPAPPVDPAAHQPLGLAPERYVLGKIVLDVSYEAAHLSVNANLHSFSHELNRKFVDRFYSDFHQQYAGRYGDEDVIIEHDYEEDAGGAPGKVRTGGPWTAVPSGQPCRRNGTPG